ncbi:DUF2726 domain-containing protein [Marinobacter salarius]|uniref:AAA domain-containing protein n=1 Tax=Marinobacter salarius TaxID=1420917 RepID=UPI0018F26ED2|nr:AAA domain-containing protein [Marinobacter salarius]MBJ7275361.1 DUF2726 domain-containing protein [Marinobacter salarius]|tara:strand:+ start:1158 stop:3881 length:2724 start_codon:yes stop_codon:yes gene_type:complete
MVTVHVDGQDKTGQISDWRIGNSRSGLELICRFPSGKSYKRPLSECEITPTEVMEDVLLVKNKGSTFSHVDRAVVYGNKQAVVQYSLGAKSYIMNMDNIRLVEKAKLKEGDIFRYFLSVAGARLDKAKESSEEDDAISDNVLRQLKALPPIPEVVLHAYCTGFSRPREEAENLIFPFGINESQLKAVAGVFASQVSVIEGPPGTGKTQTILNILANVVLRNETVAILSNNNSAVENVYDKLEKEGLDFLVAKLGNSKNREDFFANTPKVPSGELPPAPQLEDIEAQIAHLKTFLHARNEVAKLQAEIDELTVEREHLLKWRRDNLESHPLSPRTDPLEKYRLSKQKITDLMAYLTMLDDKPISLRNRIELWLNFRVLRTKPFKSLDNRDATIHDLQLRYYDRALQKKEADFASCQEVLDSGDFESLLAGATASSMAYLKEQLQRRQWPAGRFSAEDYRKDIDEFLKRYPIIGSGTHSIINSLKSGTVLDYAIIDEASMQDIVPGVLALGCARNLVIVGDRKQLYPVFKKTGTAPPDERYDCEKHSLLDSCLRVFGDTIPVTLLKEHYRCHPRIIQFCNQQFYDSLLIPMTRDRGEKALRLIVTAKGNHARRYKNQRELDSLLHVLEGGESNQWDEATKRGFIAPYNAQVNLSHSHLPASFVKDTTHKFQGRECDEIVFSTVLDKKASSRRNLSFVDDPHLINVAVSRAKKQFTLVTGEDVFDVSNGPVAALIRYVEYYANETEQVHRSPVVSAFDLLYSEYDQSLEKLRSRLRPTDSQFKSEQIVAQILREQLSLPSNRAITFHSQIALNQLVSHGTQALTASERGFMKGRSRCDFVLYFKVGKKPLAVIEVDGGEHDKAQQKKWDALKDSILDKGGLPLLRLKTVESYIEEKVENFLAAVSGDSTS